MPRRPNISFYLTWWCSIIIMQIVECLVECSSHFVFIMFILLLRWRRLQVIKSEQKQSITFWNLRLLFFSTEKYQSGNLLIRFTNSELLIRTLPMGNIKIYPTNRKAFNINSNTPMNWGTLYRTVIDTDHLNTQIINEIHVVWRIMVRMHEAVLHKAVHFSLYKRIESIYTYICQM